MVNYGCSICGKFYDTYKKAKDCEKRGINTEGPVISSGMILAEPKSEDVRKFIVFYGEELNHNFHDKIYLFECMRDVSGFLQSTAPGKTESSMLIYRLRRKDLVKISNKELANTKKLIDKMNRRGSNVYKKIFKEQGIKKVHNNYSCLDEYLK